MKTFITILSLATLLTSCSANMKLGYQLEAEGNIEKQEQPEQQAQD